MRWAPARRTVWERRPGPQCPMGIPQRDPVTNRVVQRVEPGWECVVPECGEALTAAEGPEGPPPDAEARGACACGRPGVWAAVATREDGVATPSVAWGGGYWCGRRGGSGACLLWPGPRAGPRLPPGSPLSVSSLDLSPERWEDSDPAPPDRRPPERRWPAAPPPAAEDLRWLHEGPLAQLGRARRLYGWEGRPGGAAGETAAATLSVPGSGTQSWLFMPIIALALQDLEAGRGWARGSVGRRDVVPEAQADLWRAFCAAQAASAGDPSCLLAALSLRLGSLADSGAPLWAELCQPSAWRWAAGADHLEAGLQQRAVGPLQGRLHLLVLELQEQFEAASRAGAPVEPAVARPDVDAGPVPVARGSASRPEAGVRERSRSGLPRAWSPQPGREAPGAVPSAGVIPAPAGVAGAPEAGRAGVSAARDGVSPSGSALGQSTDLGTGLVGAGGIGVSSQEEGREVSNIGGPALRPPEVSGPRGILLRGLDLAALSGARYASFLEAANRLWRGVGGSGSVSAAEVPLAVGGREFPAVPLVGSRAPIPEGLAGQGDGLDAFSEAGPRAPTAVGREGPGAGAETFREAPTTAAPPAAEVARPRRTSGSRSPRRASSLRPFLLLLLPALGASSSVLLGEPREIVAGGSWMGYGAVLAVLGLAWGLLSSLGELRGVRPRRGGRWPVAPAAAQVSGRWVRLGALLGAVGGGQPGRAQPLPWDLLPYLGIGDMGPGGAAPDSAHPGGPAAPSHPAPDQPAHWEREGGKFAFPLTAPAVVAAALLLGILVGARVLTGRGRGGGDVRPTATPPWRAPDLRASSLVVLRCGVAACVVVVEAELWGPAPWGYVPSARYPGPGQVESLVRGAWVLGALCSLWERAGFFRMRRLLALFRRSERLGIPPLSTELAGGVVLLGLLRACLLGVPGAFEVAPPEREGWWWWEGPALAATQAVWPRALPGLFLSLGVAHDAAVAAEAEMAIGQEEGRRAELVVSILRHPSVLDALRQGASLSWADGCVVWWAYSPAFLVLAVYLWLGYLSFGVVAPAEAWSWGWVVDRLGSWTLASFGLRLGPLKLLVVSCLLLVVLGAGLAYLVFELANLPLDLAEVCDRSREDRDLLVAGATRGARLVAGLASPGADPRGASLPLLSGASPHAVAVYSAGAAQASEALSVAATGDEVAEALGHFFRGGRQQWTAETRRQTRVRAAQRRGAVLEALLGSVMRVSGCFRVLPRLWDACRAWFTGGLQMLAGPLYGGLSALALGGCALGRGLGRVWIGAVGKAFRRPPAPTRAAGARGAVRRLSIGRGVLPPPTPPPTELLLSPRARLVVPSPGALRCPVAPPPAGVRGLRILGLPLAVLGTVARARLRLECARLWALAGGCGEVSLSPGSIVLTPSDAVPGDPRLVAFAQGLTELLEGYRSTGGSVWSGVSAVVWDSPQGSLGDGVGVAAPVPGLPGAGEPSAGGLGSWRDPVDPPNAPGVGPGAPREQSRAPLGGTDAGGSGGPATAAGGAAGPLAERPGLPVGGRGLAPDTEPVAEVRTGPLPAAALGGSAPDGPERSAPPRRPEGTRSAAPSVPSPRAPPPPGLPPRLYSGVVQWIHIREVPRDSLGCVRCRGTWERGAEGVLRPSESWPGASHAAHSDAPGCARTGLDQDEVPLVGLAGRLGDFFRQTPSALPRGRARPPPPVEGVRSRSGEHSARLGDEASQAAFRGSSEPPREVPEAPRDSEAAHQACLVCGGRRLRSWRAGTRGRGGGDHACAGPTPAQGVVAVCPVCAARVPQLEPGNRDASRRRGLHAIACRVYFGQGWDSRRSQGSGSLSDWVFRELEAAQPCLQLGTPVPPPRSQAGVVASGREDAAPSVAAVEEVDLAMKAEAEEA